MREVEDFIVRRVGEQQLVMRHFHDWLTTGYGLRPRLRYGIPFYDGRTWICYLNPIGLTGVELVFIRGNELEDTLGVLSSRGRRQVRGLIVERLADIPEGPVDGLIREAILLDQTRAYVGKRRK